MPKPFEDFVPYGATVFCEDIRREEGGSLTLVGVMMSNIKSKNFPFLMPKFALFTTIILPREDVDGVTKHKIEYLVYLPGNDKPTFNLNSVADVQSSPGDELDDDVPRHVKINQQVVISPFEISQAGLIKVRANVNGRMIKAGVIKVLAE